MFIQVLKFVCITFNLFVIEEFVLIVVCDEFFLNNRYSFLYLIPNSPLFFFPSKTNVQPHAEGLTLRKVTYRLEFYIK